MIEIAISLAIIGIALVGIIGVLPLGLNTQRANREQTVINQDATVFMEDIRNGVRGADDLTNYVYAITNSWTQFNANGSVQGSGVNSYTSTAASVNGASVPAMAMTNGANIVGLLSTPEFLNADGGVADSIYTVAVSNHVVASVRSISGPAFEKPPQDNSILQQDSFSYRIYCVNALAGNPTQLWQAQNYNAGDVVAYVLNNQTTTTYWKAIVAEEPPGTPPPLPPQAGDVPNSSSRWVEINNYYQQIAGNLHELRLTFLWPVLPNGKLPAQPFHATYRTLVAGAMTSDKGNGQPFLYFYQPQSFTTAP